MQFISTYQGKVYVLDNDLDFGGNSCQPVGGSGVNFTGTLYGNRHTISRLTIATAASHGALFHGLANGSVYDLIIASSCVFSFNPNKSFDAGCLAGYVNSGTIVNVHASSNITVSNSG